MFVNKNNAPREFCILRNLGMGGTHGTYDINEYDTYGTEITVYSKIIHYFACF